MDTTQIPTGFDLVTPDDNTPCHANGIIYTGGACQVLTEKNETVILPAAWANIIFPLQIKKVFASNTSATSVGVFR